MQPTPSKDADNSTKDGTSHEKTFTFKSQAAKARITIPEQNNHTTGTSQSAHPVLGMIALRQHINKKAETKRKESSRKPANNRLPGAYQ